MHTRAYRHIAYINAHVYTRIQAHAYIHPHTYTRIQGTHTYTRIHTCTHTCTHTHTHTHTCAHIYTHIHTHIYKHTFSRAHAYTHIHIHIHTHTLQGHSKAICTLGWCYSKGHGVIQNENKAAKLFLSAAELRLPEGQFNLGEFSHTKTTHTHRECHIGSGLRLTEGQFNQNSHTCTRTHQECPKISGLRLPEGQFNLGQFPHTKTIIHAHTLIENVLLAVESDYQKDSLVWASFHIQKLS
jgi:hypothetical protein